jgi:hypothetical protein
MSRIVLTATTLGKNRTPRSTAAKAEVEMATSASHGRVTQRRRSDLTCLGGVSATFMLR